MSSRKSKTSNQIVKYQQITLLELLDRLLDKGVMVKGEILLSVADIDLVYLNLGVLLSSVKTVENAAIRGRHEEAELISPRTSFSGEFWEELELAAGRNDEAPEPFPKENSQCRRRGGYEEAASISRQTSSRKEFWDEPQLAAETKEASAISSHGENKTRRSGARKTIARALPSAVNYGSNQSRKPKTNIDPQNVEKGLAKLVLTLVELIRKLMEKQAIRRIEDGQLDVREIENVGNAFLLLDEKMEELKKMFGLTDEDLNLDLGPLGELL